jgi:hypothetical protein
LSAWQSRLVACGREVAVPIEYGSSDLARLTELQKLLWGDMPPTTSFVRVEVRPGAPCKADADTKRALTIRQETGKSYRQIYHMISGPCPHLCRVCGDAERPMLIASGLHPRKQKARCLTCRCTIRPELMKEKVCGRCAQALRSRMVRANAALRNGKPWPVRETCIFTFPPSATLKDLVQLP